MMGFSCMKAVYEFTPYLHSRKKYITIVPDTQVHHSQESQQACKEMP